MSTAESTLESMIKEVKTASAVSDQERELAREAQDEYSKGNIFTCSDLLDKIELLRPQDLKVTHNKIIVNYCKSEDSSKTEILQKSLNAISVQGNSTANNPASAAETENVDKSVLRYNQAVILYHSGQYQAALNIVNSLFALIEPMEENLVHKVCLLLIELHLSLGRPDAALSLVNYIEGQFTSNADSTKSTLAEQSPNQKHEIIIKANTRTLPAMAAVKEQNKDSIDVATDAFRIKLLKYKLKIYLKTLQLKLCKREWKTLVSLGMPTNISTIFLKANLEYLRKNFKKSMKLLNAINNETCPDLRSCGESIPVLYYNNIASLHFAMGKPNLACFYLKTALEENKKAIQSIKTVGNVNSEDPSSLLLHIHQRNKHYELMYSLGVSFLYTGQATKAFDCFIEAAQQLHNNARLWLRMAECCILCYKNSNKIDFDIPVRRKDIVEKIIGENNGNGVSKKFILASSLSKNCKYSAEGLSYAIPQPTLEYGILCLKNALFLLTKTSSEEINFPVTNLTVDGEAKKTITSHQQQSSLLGSLTPSTSHKLGNNTNSTGHTNHNQSPTQTIPSQCTVFENLNLKISILSASAYTSLCLGDYVSSLQYAKSLLNIKKLPGAQWLLGSLYAAESLIFLDRISEAMEYLKPDNLQDINTYLPIGETMGDKEKTVEEVIEQKSSKVQWYPTNVATAKSILRYNLAVAYAIRGELDKSGETLKQVWTSKSPNCDVPIHVIMLALYIELQLGHVEIARSLIKQHYSPV